jgi:hypothetical protein
MLFAKKFYKTPDEPEKTQGELFKQKEVSSKLGVAFALAPLHRTVHIDHRSPSVAGGDSSPLNKRRWQGFGDNAGKARRPL